LGRLGDKKNYFLFYAVVVVVWWLKSAFYNRWRKISTLASFYGDENSVI
jgi:hypothetical protein